MDVWSTIANWQVEATSRDTNRYFFITRDFNDIMDGQHCLVVGGKGTGKTALSLFIESRSSPEVLCLRLRSGAYRFTNFIKQSRDSSAPREYYLQLWRHFILETARSMIQNADTFYKHNTFEKKVDASHRQLITFLSRFHIFKEWIGDYEELSCPGTEQAKVELESLEKLINKWADGRRFIIIFDELDEGYTGQREYLECYQALVDACEQFARDPDSLVKPIVVFRDDIYESLPPGRSSKWGDIKVELKWDLPTIQRLLAFRIARAFDENMSQEEPSFSAEWERLFSPTLVPDGTKQVEKFDFIAARTLGRPRDYIKFIQECAKLMRDDEENHKDIDSAILKNAESPYSDYLWAELRDLAAPHCSNGTFEAIKKTAPDFTIEAFHSALAEAHSSEVTYEKALHELRVLSKLEIISNLDESPPGSFAIHKGLFCHIGIPENC
jgi:hypothetical protein